MNILRTLLLAPIGAFVLAGAAYGQVPASNDTSDSNKNTGMGTGALGGPLASSGGLENTATGFDALYSITTGSVNTASGVYALYSNTTGTANTASGSFALGGNMTGMFNAAFGSSLGLSVATGRFGAESRGEPDPLARSLCAESSAAGADRAGPAGARERRRSPGRAGRCTPTRSAGVGGAPQARVRDRYSTL